MNRSHAPASEGTAIRLAHVRAPRRLASVALAAAAIAAPLAAQAAPPSINVYGAIDAFAEYNSGGSQGKRFALDSGGLIGSRWGLKGELSLASVAPDLKAIYQLEGGLFVNNGQHAQGGRLFGRQAYAGLTGHFGTLTIGRQYTPLFNTIGNYDAFGYGYGSPANDGQVSYGLDARYNQSLIYTMPAVGGFGASAMVATGNQTGGSGKNAVSIGANYAAGPFGAGLAWQRDDHRLATNATVENYFAGASYKVGIVKLMGGVSGAQSKPDGGATLRRHEWMLGSQIHVTQAGQLWLAYGTGRTSGATPSDKSQAFSAAWVQSLTKEARLYFIGSIHTNGAGASLVPVGTSSSGAYTISPGNTARALAIGFQYDL